MVYNKKRYKREKTSLQRLSSFHYFPKPILFEDKNNKITMSRLPGDHPETLSKKQIEILRRMVISMHNKGVARHAIPIRDLLCNNDQELYMVDFERVTLRYTPFSPIWCIAKKVTNFHLYRLIQDHQTQMLTASEKRILLKTNQVRSVLQKIKPFKEFVKKYLRDN